MRTRHHAFTLIELLIVVAIIAILAAIAVPNYLEAQTRAKVSRTKSDMRTLTTAIESYRVDWNNYPYLAYSNRMNTPDENNLELHELTTPVSFITTIPVDIYRDPGEVSNGQPQIDYFHLINFFSRSMIPAPPLPSGTPDWTLTSVGPNRLFDYGTTGEPILYDPTNGTLSVGDVYWDNLQTQLKQ